MNRQLTNSADDETLRDLILSDPEKGWENFRLRFKAFLHSLIRRYGFSEEDTEEVYQEILLRLVKDNNKLLRAWDPARCSLRGYLGVVATSVSLNYLRSSFHRFTQRRVFPERTPGEPTELLDLVQDPAPSPAERLHRMDLASLFEKCIEEWSREGSLRPEDCLILGMRLSGLGQSEIARMLGTTPSNVGVRFYRLKKELKKRLKRANLKDLDLAF